MNVRDPLFSCIWGFLICLLKGSLFSKGPGLDNPRLLFQDPCLPLVLFKGSRVGLCDSRNSFKEARHDVSPLQTNM